MNRLEKDKTMDMNKVDDNYITISGKTFNPNDILEIKPSARGTVVVFYSGKGFYTFDKKDGFINKLFDTMLDNGYSNFVFLKDRIINLDYIDIREVLNKKQAHLKEDVIRNGNHNLSVKFNDFYTDIIKCGSQYELQKLKDRFFDVIKKYNSTKNETLEHY